MQLKLLGAVMIVFGCGGFGFSMAHTIKMEEKMLRQICVVLDYMKCELQYRMTSLPELCVGAANEINGTLSIFLKQLAEEMEQHSAADVSGCTNAALNNKTPLPEKIKKILHFLGQSLGKFDLQGQLAGLNSVQDECRRELKMIEYNRDERLRSYRTLGLCAGIAIVIIFI